jgi:hypothetical protein
LPSSDNVRIGPNFSPVLPRSAACPEACGDIDAVADSQGELRSAARLSYPTRLLADSSGQRAGTPAGETLSACGAAATASRGNPVPSQGAAEVEAGSAGASVVALPRLAGAPKREVFTA